MSSWPETDEERLTGALLRVDLHESRYLAVGELHNVVNLLLRSAAAACLLDREPDALAYCARAGVHMGEWVAAGTQAKSALSDLAAARGLLALAIGPHPSAKDTAAALLRRTEKAPPGPIHNARLAAAALLGDSDTLQASARACELSDAGLGAPWKRFALALDAHDVPAMQKSALAWLREKMEATHTNEWGAYNEVPIEVSGALALARIHDWDMRLPSNRVLSEYRSV